MNNLQKIIIAIIVVLSLISYNNRKKPVNIIDTVPTPAVEIIKNEIIINDYAKSIELSKKINKPLLVILKSNWCRFCKQLEKDFDKLNLKNKFVICLLDINYDKNLTKAFEIKGLPTSVIIDCSGNKNIEISRKEGYIYEDYYNWIMSFSLYNNDN